MNAQYIQNDRDIKMVMKYIFKNKIGQNFANSFKSADHKRATHSQRYI